MSITVNNVAPTATFGNNGPVGEGSAFNLSLTSPFDPSSVDTAAGFTYAFDCGDGAGYGAFTASNTASCSTTDNGMRTVKGKIQDKDGGVTEYSGSVTINNVAPTATFGNNGPVDEGSAFNLSLTSPFDPSSVDTAAGFTYAFDCGDGTGYGAFSASNTASCPTTDNGMRTVKGKIQDKDGGVTEYSGSVTINNVAPTATFGNNGPVNEGSPATVSFSNQQDPSSADTNTGFHYAFSCTNGDLSGSTYADSSTDASTSCTFYDNGTYTVKGRIIDKDGGFTEYTTAVVVNNVVPTITSVVAGAAASCGANNSITVNFTDPGTLDTWSASIDWGDGTTTNLPSVTSGFGASHMYAHAGVYTVGVVVTDDDGGISAPTTAQVTLNFNLSGILQPINPGPPNSIFKYGSTIPVKVKVQDCDGSYPGNLTLKVTWQLLSGGDPTGGINEPYSTSAADTGNTMRFTGSPDYQYIFNLASKSFPDGAAIYRIYVTIQSTNQVASAGIGLKLK